MAEFEQFLQAQKKILSERKYFALFAATTVFFAWLFITFTSIPGQTLESWSYSMNNTMKMFFTAASILLGLIFTTQVFVFRNFRFSMHEAKSGGSALGAFATGVIATACCSPLVAGILALAGFAGAGAFILQYEVEASAIALAVLLASLYYSSKIVFCSECRVKTGASKQ